MKVILTDRVIESLKDAPAPVRRAFNKQLRFLLQNLNHPSLNAKKYDQADGPLASPRQSELALLFQH